jgi:hypothetical protein
MRQTESRRPRGMAADDLAPARKKSQQDADWARLIGLVPRDEQEELRQMLVVSRQRKELLLRLIYQQRYKNVLEFWLYIHVPFTIALLAFACTAHRGGLLLREDAVVRAGRLCGAR